MAKRKAPLIPSMTGLLAIRSERDFFDYEKRVALLLDKVDTKLLSSYYDYHNDEESKDSESTDDMYMVLERERLQIINNVAIFNIKGMMSSNYSFLEGYFDEGTSYESIVWSVKYVKNNHPEVDTVLGLFDTPGGEARGVNGAVEAFKGLSAGLAKGSYAYSYGELASAGYALASGFDVILGDSWSDIGSVGVVIPLLSRYKALKDAGIDVYVARSGSDKMRPSGLEPITDKDKEIVDAEVAEKAQLFFSLVMASRPSTVSTKSSWETGKMFSARQAVEVGLLDGIQSQSIVLDRLLS